MTKNNGKTLILYSTVDGHTKNICDYIKKNLSSNFDSEIIMLEDFSQGNLEEYEKLIIGASVRYGYHRKNLYEFINNNKVLLEKKDVAFFSVNLTARKSEKNTADTNPYIVKFLDKMEWDPKIKDVFAGKLDYPNYDCINRLAILLIMVITNGPKDISKVYELTDWDRVDQFIIQINKSL